MPGLSLGLGINVSPKRGGASSVIWKVAIFGAGTASSNGEYVWDGNELQDGKLVYRNGSNVISFGDFGGESAEWGLYDDTAGDNTYLSSNLITWVSNGYGTAPSSALSYAQDSFISSITISYPDLSLMDGAYSRASGGTTTLYDGSNYNYINYSAGTWYLWSEDIADNVGNSLDLVKWNANAGFQDPINVTAVSYSA